MTLQMRPEKLFWAFTIGMTMFMYPFTCHASPPVYRLQKRYVAGHRILVNIYDPVAGRTVWPHSLLLKSTNQLNRYCWSPDHQALAIAEEHIYVKGLLEGFRLFVWRAGQSVQVFDQFDVLRQAVTILQMAWSPDKSRLLLRVSLGEGEAEIGEGALCHLDMVNGKIHTIASVASHAHWVSSRKVAYTEVTRHLVGAGTRNPHYESVETKKQMQIEN